MTQISRILPNRRLSTIEFYLDRLRGAGEQTTAARSEASYGNPTLPDSNPCHPRNPWLAFRPKIRVYRIRKRRKVSVLRLLRCLRYLLFRKLFGFFREKSGQS